MIIAVNTRLLLPGKIEGIGRFTLESLKIITKAHPEHTFVFIFDRKFSDDFIFSSNIIPVIGFPQARHPLLWYLFFECSIPRILNEYKADLFLSPDGWLSLHTKVKSLAVIHDLNFYHHPDYIPFLVRKYYFHFFPQFIKKASRIATVSEFTRQDIAYRFPEKEKYIDVVYNGSREFLPYSEEDREHVRQKYTGGCQYFLFVGLIHPRKNLTGLIRAFDSFRKETDSKIKLLIVGERKWWTEDMQQALDGCAFKQDIIFTGRISDEFLAPIMVSALSLVYVSHFEGFGLPVLEAMHAEIPVICSATSSLPEVGGNAVIYVNPADTESIKMAMVKICFDDKLRNELVQKARIQRAQFSWKKTAGLLWESIEKVYLD